MLQYSEETAFDLRKLDTELASKMGCRFENGKFVFDYTNRDELISRKIRTPDKKFWFEPKGQPLQLWNLDGLRGLGSRPVEPLIICEGEFDAIAVNQACGGYVVSVPNGGSSKRSEGAIYADKDQGFAYLWAGGKLITEVDQFDRIILATDSDETGQILRDELALRVGEARCWFLTYPEGCKDANDVLREYGAETLARVIKCATPMRPGYLVKPSELPARQTTHAYSTGWEELDRRLMLTRPELMVVTGIPGHGKGQWIRSLAFRLAMAHGWRTAFFTPEDPYERLKRDMFRFAAGHKLPVRDWVDQHFRISHTPQDERITISVVMSEMEAAAFQHDCQVFVLDPWNEISHERKGRLETEYVEDALVDLKRKARRLKMLLVIVAHPRKIDDGKPNLYSISGSANWKNKCDHGVIVYRSTPEDDAAQIIVEKCKDHETMGTPGLAWMRFDRNAADFTVTDGGR